MKRLIVLHRFEGTECSGFREKMGQYSEVILSSERQPVIGPEELNQYEMVFIISKDRDLPEAWSIEQVMRQTPVILILSTELPDLATFIGMFEVMGKVQVLHPTGDSHQAELFRKSLLFVEENLGNSGLVLDELAAFLFISPSYCSRLFRKYTGKGFREYVIDRRIQLAKVLLEGGSSVTETCFAVGYSDLTHFTRVFRRRVGSNPSSYRLTGRTGWEEKQG